MVLNIGAPTPDNAEIVLGVAGKVQCLNIRKGCNEADISEMRVSLWESDDSWPWATCPPQPFMSRAWGRKD